MKAGLALQISTEIEKINSYFVDQGNLSSSIDLYTGLSGSILLMGQNFLSTNNNVYLERIDSYLALSMDQIEKSLYHNRDFSLELSGWGWVLNYLSQHEITDSDDLLSNINGYLDISMSNLLENGNYDQLNGAIRIGRYFLANGKFKQVKKIITYLNRIKVVRGDEIKWLKEKESSTPMHYDLGLAHGAAGIVQFLATCLENHICEEECFSLMEGSIRFILNNIQDHNISGSYFPSMVPAGEHESVITNPTLSRLAWCYGDLGIWYTLYTTSVLIKNEELEKRSMAGLQMLTGRRSFDETLVVDAGFCHGSSGIAHIFNKLWITTQDTIFEDARDFWLLETINYGVGNYKFLVGNFENRAFKPCDTLLEGLIGVDLTYNSCLNPEYIKWDACLLLS